MNNDICEGFKMYYTEVKILIVEDNPADARLIMEALKNFEINTNIHLVGNGIEAMKFLYQQGKYEEMLQPDLVILDLNLPLKDGREVLKEIKTVEKLKCIPVIILTTSRAKEDIIQTYKNHANCYIKKPVDFNHFMEVIDIIQNFWFAAVTLPSKLAEEVV